MQQRCNPSTGEPVCSPCPAGSYMSDASDATVDHGHSLNLYQTSSLKRVKGTPFTDPKYEKETGTPCGLLHYGRWSGDFEFIGGEWKFCNVAADGDLRVKVDGKVVIDTTHIKCENLPRIEQGTRLEEDRCCRNLRMRRRHRA